jgi:ADP-ribosylglycohydrolase
MKKINASEYFDKVYGGWLGKCLGGAAGAPVEGIKDFIESSFWDTMQPDLPNDDLDLQLLWLETVRENGLSVTAKKLADAWDKKCWYPFSEYGLFLKNYDRGIWPPASGSFNNPLFCEGEGSPIRSEIWAMLFPGNPDKAAKYAELDSSLDHYGESVYIEQFYAALGSEAFFCQDLQKLIERNIRFLPPTSKARACVDLVVQQTTKEWKEARHMLLKHFGHNDFSNSVTNLGIVLIALLFGNNDMESTIDIAYRSGFDTDCTCATSAALLGIMFGAESINPKLRSQVQDSFVTGIKLDDENRSIRILSEQTCKVSESLVEEYREPLILSVQYDDKPAIGIADTCSFKICLENNSAHTMEGVVHLEGLPKYWNVEWTEKEVTLAGNSQLLIPNTVDTCNTRITCLHAKNILQLSFLEEVYSFGIAGSSIWNVYGPFSEALKKEDQRDLPKPHTEGCVLPNLECMVNNAVYLHKEYPYATDTPILMSTKEDLLPIDMVFPYFIGQGCWYAEQEFLSPDERDVWLVIGNNDGFTIWINNFMVLEKDEIRLWTPYNNSNLVHVKQGKNTIRIKLLRRTENLRFSLAFRLYNGVHYHRNRWIVDMDSLMPTES